MRQQVILFDLDGTLTDPAEGITNAIAHALTYYGIHITDKRTLLPLIGPPLHDSFMRHYGMDEGTAREAIDHYREHFATKGLFENQVYPGVEEMLRQLHATGKQLVVATSKPELFAVRILEHFGLAKYFVSICGAPMYPPTGFGKTDVIKDALRRIELSDPATAIMVGDREHDISAAHAVGMQAVGVLYGYGDRTELEACKADYIVSSVEDLANLLREATA